VKLRHFVFDVNANVEVMFPRSRSKSFSVIKMEGFVYSLFIMKLHLSNLWTLFGYIKSAQRHFVYGVNANIEVMFPRSMSRSLSAIPYGRLV